MTSDPTIPLRVSRLENEAESIYELIDDFRSETHARFDRIEGGFDRLEGRFDRLEGGFDRLEGQTRTRFDQIENTLGEVLRRLPEPS